MKTSECKRCGKQIPDSQPVHTCTPKEIMNQETQWYVCDKCYQECERSNKEEWNGLCYECEKGDE